MSESRFLRRPVTRVTGRSRAAFDDAIAIERPLAMRVDGRPLAVTLRTPGHDTELALGFLAGESLIRSRADVREWRETAATCSDQPDEIDVALSPGVTLDWSRLERHFAANSACGLCGRAHLDSLRAGLEPIAPGERFDAEEIAALPECMRENQTAFTATGGLHAAALWDAASHRLSVVREDVGRHNAVDKVVGWRLERGGPGSEREILWVSGRAGAEIVLKAARARLPVLAAVGAPTSLAIELAEAAGLTLIGFLREGRMNVYTHVERLAEA
jgi:FdhD protein